MAAWSGRGLDCQGASAGVKQPSRFPKKFCRLLRGFAAVLPRVCRVCRGSASCLPWFCRVSAAVLPRFCRASLPRLCCGSTTAAKSYRRYIAKCPVKSGCFRRRGVGPGQTAKFGPAEPIGFLIAWAPCAHLFPTAADHVPHRPSLDAVRRAVAEFDAGA